MISRSDFHSTAEWTSGPDLTVLYEDNQVLVAIKPAGILSQADQTGKADMLTLLKVYLKEKYHKPGAVFLGLVHRLDQPVSGLMVFARTSKAAARLSEQIRNHQWGKYYLAVACGRVEPALGTLQDNLSAEKQDGRIRVVPEGQGKAAALQYRVLGYHTGQDATLLLIRLDSGRGHQIRVQFSSRGWPLVGDRRYGRPGERDQMLQNMALFACSLHFRHPTRDEWIDLSAPPPTCQPWSLFAVPELAAPEQYFLS